MSVCLCVCVCFQVYARFHHIENCYLIDCVFSLLVNNIGYISVYLMSE